VPLGLVGAAGVGGAREVTGWLALAAWALGASALHARERRRVVLAARAGHEIRGPLCAARLALEGLERSARVQAIDLELRRAALALDDLAGAGRRGRREERVERVDVGRILEDGAPAWRALARARHGGLSVEPPACPAFVLADPLRLAQACANLVANALEHGGGLARVRATTVSGRVRVEVSDVGPGLPAPIPRLVAAARGRRTTRGHGLAIAAAIAERHGGRLTTAPSIRGARVVLELPEAPPTPGTARPRRIPFARRRPRGQSTATPASPSLPAASGSSPAASGSSSAASGSSPAASDSSPAAPGSSPAAPGSSSAASGSSPAAPGTSFPAAIRSSP
jgi:signal transduction histidine kinase